MGLYWLQEIPWLDYLSILPGADTHSRGGIINILRKSTIKELQTEFDDLVSSITDDMNDWQRCVVGFRLEEILKIINSSNSSQNKQHINKLRYEGSLFKDDIINSYGGKCNICDSEWTSILEIHHLIPLSLGGTNDIHNLIPLCPNCHRIVHMWRRSLNNHNHNSEINNNIEYLFPQKYTNRLVEIIKYCRE